MLVNRKHHRSAGFTLIEAAVTMGIFAILVAVGVPTMRTWVANTKVRGVTDALQNGLRVAQAESLRRSRQVIFALTNSTTPQNTPVAAAANATAWAIYSLPSMTDGSETATFIESGVLSNATTTIAVSSGGAAAFCFNSLGRLVSNSSASVTAVTGGATCGLPGGTPAVQNFQITSSTGDRPLNVQLYVGGQIHMCDPHFTLSSTNPEGC